MKINTEKVKLDNGIYPALWSGYNLEILLVDNESYNIKTTSGVKGINCSTVIEVVNGDVIIKQ